MLFKFSKDFYEIEQIFLKESGNNNNIVKICFILVSKILQDQVYLLLDISDGIIITYYSNIKYFLTLIGNYYERILIFTLNQLLVKEPFYIKHYNIFCSLVYLNNIILSIYQIDVYFRSLIKALNIDDYLAFTDSIYYSIDDKYQVTYQDIIPRL